MSTNPPAYNGLPALQGQIKTPLQYGATGNGVTADDVAIATAIASIPVAGGILDMSGAAVAYGVTHPIALNPGISMIGTFINNQDSATGANKTDIVCLASFAGTAVIGDAAGLNQGASVACVVSSGAGGAALFTGTNTYTANLPVVINPTTTTAPGGFVNGALYYVAASPAPTGSAFYLALAPGGTAIAFTTAGSGVTVGNSSPTSSIAVSVRGVSIDKTNVTSATESIRLMTARSNVEYCFIRGCQSEPAGIHFADQSAGGFNITNSANENACRFNWLVHQGGTGILVDRHVNALTDGFCIYNLIEQQSINLGDLFSSTGPAIDIENGADWQVNGNHVYRIPGNAIVINHAFTSFICHNKVDNFGTAGAAATTYRGIWIQGANGPSCTVTDNEIDTREDQAAAATTNYNYFEFDNASGLVGQCNSSGNSVRKTNNNPFNGNSFAISVSGAGGGTMAVTDWGMTSVATAAPAGTSVYLYTATNATPCVFTAAGTGLVANQPVTISTGAPTGFTNGTTYFVTAPAGTSFSLAATAGGAAIASTSTGAGNLIVVTTAPSMTPNVTGGGGSILRGPMPAAATFNPANPAVTASTTQVMMGLGTTCVYTPALTGKLRITISGAVLQNTAIAAVAVSGRWGTVLSGVPANGAALTGTAFPQGTISIGATSGAIGVYNRPFVCEAVSTGFVIGTQYWFDLGCSTGTAADTAGPGSLQVTIEEIN